MMKLGVQPLKSGFVEGRRGEDGQFALGKGHLAGNLKGRDNIGPFADWNRADRQVPGTSLTAGMRVLEIKHT